jgi:hypothetical protein
MKANLIENDYFCGNFSLNNRSLNIRIVVIFLINIHKYFIFICSNTRRVFLFLHIYLYWRKKLILILRKIIIFLIQFNYF